MTKDLFDALSAHDVPVTLGPIQEKVFRDRYARKDPDGVLIEHHPEEMWRRVADAVAAVEPTPELRALWAERFYRAMRGFRFVPGGRILAGAGTGRAVTLFNCFVVPSPEDSRAGILENLTLAVEIMARGGGFGVNLSTLRPRGSHIASVNGTSSGPCAWAELYSVATGDVIQQGGSRRGAAMIMLDDTHPDIEEFVTAKRRPGVLEHANLSVCVSDALMAAVGADADWPLSWDGKVRKTLRARDLWHLICESAWASAEPGVVFIDRHNQLSNTRYYETIRCVNPCVTGETLIYTANGLIPAVGLAQRSEQVVVASLMPEDEGVTFRLASNVVATGSKPVFRLRTIEGYDLRLTADHKLLTTSGWKKAIELRPGHKIHLMTGVGGFGEEGSHDLGMVTGWLVGDGYIRRDRHCIVLKFFGAEKRELAPHFAEAVSRLVKDTGQGRRAQSVGVNQIPPSDEARVASVRLSRVIDPAILRNKLQTPPSVERGSRAMQVGFLQGLFTADGTIAGNREKGVSVRLASISLPLLRGVQRLLLNLGVASRIYENRRREMECELPDGRGGKRSYVRKALHELVISKANVPVFAQRIGFLSASKRAFLGNELNGRARGFYRESYLATFKDLTPDGVAEVYDLTEPTAHRFVANGLVVHNCAEEGLPPFGVCNLGALNLAAFVVDGLLFHDHLAAYTKVALRFLDDVIDATGYFLDENRRAQLGTRRTGLGTMGLADALLTLGIRYGSDESLAEIERIYRTIRDAAYDASCDLAAEKGPFPRFDRAKYGQGPFIQHLPPDIQVRIDEGGIRNAVLLCQAPTGTTSLLAGVSSGIEPIFAFAMVRRDGLGEHVIHHPLYAQWRREHPKETLPPQFVTAADLAPEEHVRVQALIQRYTDASISKTVNAPNHHTVARVETLYRQAYDLGCKGITYYRDGSRDAVLNHLESTQAGQPRSTATRSHPPRLRPRPSLLPGATYRVPTPVGTAFVTVNDDADGHVREVFVTVGRAGSDVSADAEAIGRLISLVLRIPTDFGSERLADAVIDQLAGIGGRQSLGFGPRRVRSLADGVAHALAAHLSRGRHDLASASSPQSRPEDRAVAEDASDVPWTPHPVADLCPQCGQAALVAESGCYTCHACGHSPC